MLQQEVNNNKVLLFDFIQNGKKIENAPTCGMTLRAAGTMRFRWNEKNENRTSFLRGLSPLKKFVPVELIHSHIVYHVKDALDTANLQGDGIITTNKELVPVVTVADCMPLYLYNPCSGLFGVVHSGWKGTGIISDAIKLAQKNNGDRPQDFSVILGPHIGDCCYIVNEERADFFRKEFASECVKELEEGGECFCGGRGLPVTWNNGSGRLYRLSLKKANLAVLEKAGVKPENINIIEECTCCNEKFGSNRRETALAGVPDKFTVQAAFINI